MKAVLAFAITLLIATLLSERAHRSILLTAVLFLVVGCVIGNSGWKIFPTSADNNILSRFSELALFSVLFTDGMRLGIRDLKSAWHLPGRALLLGMPLTFITIGIFARWIINLPWSHALLLGAALSPTDPVFASAIVKRQEMPGRLRHLLNVESGLNDGLALPIVIFLLTMLNIPEKSAIEGGKLLGEAALGLSIGIIIPWLILRLEQSRFFGIAESFKPFDAFAIGLVVLALTNITGCNEFLAAFAAGITIASVSSEVRDQFQIFGQRITELLKLSALLLFGALISTEILLEIGWSGYIFAILVLFAARPLSLVISLMGSSMTWPERLTAAWFGPKGFASVLYGLYILNASIPQNEHLFHVTAIVVAGSIIAHSSTDVLFARWFHHEEEKNRNDLSNSRTMQKASPHSLKG